MAHTYGEAKDDIDHLGFGASPLTRRQHFLGTQFDILRRVVRGVYGLGQAQAALEAELMRRGSREEYEQAQFVLRPRQVYFIDGARGAGKTTLLLTIQHFLRFLGDPDAWRSAADPEQEVLREVCEQNQGDARSSDTWPGLSEPHQIAVGSRRKTACTLPVLFPADFEGHQCVMEGLFALMVEQLERESAVRKPSMGACEWRDSEMLALKERLHAKVAPAWHMVRPEGFDVLNQEAFGYKHYLSLRGEVGADSFNRVRLWRNFVNDYLDHFNAELLIVFLDDTDVKPAVTADMLHTIRIFLDHPRIVAMVAGHLRSMRGSLLQQAMGEAGPGIRALRSAESETAVEWRRFIRLEIEEYLEKVLPRPFRNYVSFYTPRRVQGTSAAMGETDEFRILQQQKPFDVFCREQLSAHRDRFLLIKLVADQRFRQKWRELRGEHEYAWFENFLSWWFLRHWYAERLRPKTARHWRALLEYCEVPRARGQLAARQHKRLPVILFETPENFALIHRFADADRVVADWLRRQQVSSCWNGTRYFEIDGRKIFEGTYSYHFLCYRLDLSIATPVRERIEDRIPAGLLPMPAGPNLSGQPDLTGRRRSQRVHGVALDLQHSVIPANCIYFHDVECLPDVAWKKPGTKDPWGSALVYEWPELFFLDLPEQQGAGVAEAATDRDDSDDKLREYMIDVVFPLGSLDLGRFVATVPPRGLPPKAVGEAELIRAEWNNHFFGSELLQSDALRRRFDYLGALAEGPAGRESVAGMANSLLVKWQEEFITSLLPHVPDEAGRNDDLRRHLVSYRWLINDARKAWHAARIFRNQSAETLQKKWAFDQSRRPDSKASTDPADPAEPAFRKNFFSREDRYPLTTLARLKRYVTETEDLKTIYEKWSDSIDVPGGGAGPNGKATAKEKTVKEKKRRDQMLRFANIVSDLDTLLSRLATEEAARIGPATPLTRERIDALLRRQVPTRDVGQPQPLLLLDPANSDSEFEGRLLKYLVLFVWGVAPTLPSLVHIDIASHLYAYEKGTESKNKTVDSIHAQLGRWAEFVLALGRVALRYRLLLELTKIRLDLLELEARARWQLARHGRDSRRASSFLSEAFVAANGEALRFYRCEGGKAEDSATGGVVLALAPDLPFTTLGTAGLARHSLGKPLFSPGDTGDSEDRAVLVRMNEIFERRCEDQQKVGARRPEYKPLLDDIEENLATALDFIDRMQRWADEFAKSGNGPLVKRT